MVTLPNLLLAGVPKAGTTSLYAYLTQHPAIRGGTTKEHDYFTPLRVPSTTLAPVEDYATAFAPAAGARWRVDGSPSYAIGGRAVIDAVREVLGSPRVVISLREPVARLWSAYTFLRAQGYLDDVADFDHYVDRCLEARAAGHDLDLGSRTMALGAGVYADYLGDWIEAFGPDLAVVFAEDLRDDPAAVVHDLFVWLGVDPGAVDALDTTARNRTVYARNRTLARTAYGLRAASGGLLERFPGVRRRLRALYGAVNTVDVSERMTPRTRARLDAFYAPHDRDLAALLTAGGWTRHPGWLRDRAGAP